MLNPDLDQRIGEIDDYIDRLDQQLVKDGVKLSAASRRLLDEMRINIRDLQRARIEEHDAALIDMLLPTDGEP